MLKVIIQLLHLFCNIKDNFETLTNEVISNKEPPFVNGKTTGTFKQKHIDNETKRSDVVQSVLNKPEWNSAACLKWLMFVYSFYDTLYPCIAALREKSADIHYLELL